MAGEPSGIRNGDPSPQARMGAMGSYPSRGPGGASRIACTPLGSKQVLPRQSASTPGVFPVRGCEREAQAPDSLTSQPVV